MAGSRRCICSRRCGRISIIIQIIQFSVVLLFSSSQLATCTADSADNCSPPTALALHPVLTLPDVTDVLAVGIDASGDEIHALALSAYDAGDLPLALQLFFAATRLFPFGATVWTNLGYTLLSYAESPAGGNSGEASSLLCEASAALDLAVALGGEDADVRGAAADARTLLSRRAGCDAGTECVRTCGVGDRYVRARRAMRAATPSVVAATDLCPGGIVVRPRPHELARGVLAAVTVYEAYALFRVCGVVAITELLSAEDVGKVRDEAERAFDAARDERGRFETFDLDTTEGERLALRDQSGARKRWELKLVPTAPPFSEGGVADDAKLVGLARLLVSGPNVVVDTLSTVVSLPGCPVGHWHGDVDDPFRYYPGPAENGNGRGRVLLPPPGLVAVVPLIEVGGAVDNGPTEFLMGSHVPPADGGDRWWKRQQEARTELIRSLEIAVPALPGTAVLFDIRLRHRGGANRSNKARPILYLGYTTKWFRDTSNFVDPQTKGWEALAGQDRQGNGDGKRELFQRLDTQEYTKLLEMELTEVYGADLSKLKARIVREKEEG